MITLITLHCDKLGEEVLVDQNKLGDQRDTFIYGPDELEYTFISRNKLELISILEDISVGLNGYYHEKGVIEAILAYLKYSAIKLTKVEGNRTKQRLDVLLSAFGVPEVFVKLVADSTMLSKYIR